MAEINVILPKKAATVEVVNVGVFVAPVKLIAPILARPCVNVLDPASIELASITQVSCGSGIRPVPAVPPLAFAHRVTALKLPVDVPAEGTQ